MQLYYRIITEAGLSLQEHNFKIGLIPQISSCFSYSEGKKAANTGLYCLVKTGAEML